MVQLHNTILKVKTNSAWSKVNQGVPQGSVLGPLLFLLYINDLPNAVLLNATPILFADNTSIIITGQNVLRFQEKLNAIFDNISKWFQANSLSLNVSKTHFMQCFSKNTNKYDAHVSYENNSISKVNDTKFLGININNNLFWKTHIEEMLPKLCPACFAMKSVKPFASQQMLKIIYSSYFHSITSYGVIFWGHSSLGIKDFRLQKRIIRIMTGSRNRDSCRKLFTSMEILPLPSLYIFLLLRFVIKNKDLFTTNINFHNLCTRQHHNFHQPSTNLKKYQTAVYCMAIKIFNSLPSYIKNEFTNPTKFVTLAKNFLCENSFYSLEEYFNSVRHKDYNTMSLNYNVLYLNPLDCEQRYLANF